MEFISGRKLGPSEREHHSVDKETRPAQGLRHEDGSGMLRMGLRRINQVQGGRVEADRDLEDGHGRKDLRRGRTSQVIFILHQFVRSKTRLHDALYVVIPNLALVSTG